MDRGKPDARSRGGRPRVSAGRVTARLEPAVWRRLLTEDNKTSVINQALRYWYGM